MRFTPVTHFASGLIEPCVGALASGSVSSSVNLGGVLWDIYVYSASQQNGGAQDSPSQESFTLQITKGTTNRAIVGVIGGGAGGACGNGIGNTVPAAGGGGGGFNLVENVTLVEDATYSIYVGYGATGTSRNTSPGLPFNGTDGAGSSFSKDGGGLQIEAGGGQGGGNWPTDAGVGGSSGTPTVNTSTVFAGAGAGGSPFQRGGSTNGNSLGGNGLSIFIGSGVTLRAGGGGNDPSGSSIALGGYVYGGGAITGSSVCFDSDGQGSGGELRNSNGVPSLTFGGGGGGGQHYCNADNEYRSTSGGAGAVFVAIPTNLCSGSLYTPKPIIKSSLIYYLEMGNPKVVGKQAMGQVLNNLVVGANNINHVSDLPNPDVGQNELITNYTGSVCSIISSVTSSVLSDDLVGGSDLQDFYSGSIQGLDTTAGFSVEYVGRQPTSSNVVLWRLDNVADNQDYLLLGINQKLYIGTSGGADIILQGSYTEADINQHVVTYDGSSTLKWYVNGILNVENTSAPIPSGITNPVVFLGESGPTGASDSEIQAFRVYSRAITAAEIISNYATIIT